jgi:hypothetical protein
VGNSQKTLDLKDVIPADDRIAMKLKHDHELKKSAFLGYARANFLDLEVHFGEWNPRPLEKSKVKGHLDSLEREGIQRFVPKNLIPIAVRKEWIDVANLSSSADYDEMDFPTLTLKKGFEGVKIEACGGQHRRHALEQLFEKKKKETLVKKAAYEKGAEAVAKNKADAVTVKRLGEEVDELMRILKGLGVWGFEVYDLGAPGIILT